MYITIETINYIASASSYNVTLHTHDKDDHSYIAINIKNHVKMRYYFKIYQILHELQIQHGSW